MQNETIDQKYIYLIKNQGAWANAFNEKRKKYKYDKQREEKRRGREKKEAGLPVAEALLKVEVIEAIEENK